MGRDILIHRSEDSEAKLSTIHKESDFGRPVLIVDGKSYRPNDILPSGLSAYEIVQLFLKREKPEKGKWGWRTQRAVAMAEKFR